MKYIGFIKENTKINEANSFSEMLASESCKDKELLQKVTKYLNEGIYVFGWMGYSFDWLTKAPIAPDAYFTDGTWVWPGYYSYYLNKYPQEIDENFLNHLKKNKFKINSKYFTKSILEIEDELEYKLDNYNLML